MLSRTPRSLRERQTAATRKQIVDVAMEMLTRHPAEPFTHEIIAKKAGMGARTVYRYFPRRANLMQVVWERIREETRTRFPSNEREVVVFARTQFREFDKQEAMVRASLAFSGSTEIRARGSLQGRPAFRKSLSHITAHLPPAERRRLIAVCLAIYSAPFWQLLRDRGELDGGEPGEAAAWALQAVLSAARSEARRLRGKRKGKESEEK